MPTLRVVAIAAILSLACTDSTGLSLDGPSFMRARIDGRFFSLEQQDSFLWDRSATMLFVRGMPGTLTETDNQVIYMQVTGYHGPGTYPLDSSLNASGGAFSAAKYGVFANDGVPVPPENFETGGRYRGSIRVIAEDTATIVGTFEFSAGSTTGTGEVHVTGGSFRLHH